MTVPASSRRAGPFAGTGAVSAFPFGFKVFSSAGVAVLRSTSGVETQLVEGSDYTVTLNPNQDTSPGGTVTLSAPLAAGSSLALVGAESYDQGTDLPTGGRYSAVVVENALDKLTILLQQLLELTGRALTLPATSASSSTQLPVPAAGNVIGWDDTASALRNIDPTTLASIAAYANRRTLVANGGLSSYTLAADPGNVSNTLVAVSGVVQTPGVDYTVSGVTLTPTTPWPSGTGNVVIVYGEALPVGTQDSSAVTHIASGTGAVQRTVKAKLTDELSVTDFGVDMTGATDSTVAFQTALNAASALTSGGKGVTLRVPGGVVKLSAKISVPTRVKIIGAGSRATIFNNSFNGAHFEFDGVDFSGLSGCRLGLGSGAAVIGINIVTTSTSTRWLSFNDIEIAGNSVSGQIGYRMYASGLNVITECVTVNLSTFLVDRPMVVLNSEGNYFYGISLDSFGFSTARAGIESVSLVNFFQARVAGNPTSGSVGLSEGGHRNIIDLAVDINSGSTALNDTGTGNIIRLQRPELLTPLGTYSAKTTVIDSEFMGLRRVVQRGTTPTSGAFVLTGWGSSATVSSISGHDGWLKFTVNSAGTGQTAFPYIDYTFVDGAWPSAPMIQVTRDGGSQLTVGTFSSYCTTTAWQTRFAGTPVNGEAYVFIVKVG